MRSKLKWGLTVVGTAFFLAACGGGGDNIDSNAAAVPTAAFTYSPAEPAVGEQITLNGSSSQSPSGRKLFYDWKIVSHSSGSTGEVPTDRTAQTASLSPRVAGSYVIALKVDDGVNADTMQQTITVKPENVAPVAHAGQAQRVKVGRSVTLDGSASRDGNGDTITYQWQLAAPAGSNATLDDAGKAKPRFTADVAGEYTATLIVHDGKLNSTAATVTVTGYAQNTPPVAHAGAAQQVKVGVPVTLDGSASRDDDAGDILTYSWTLVGQPAGSTTSLHAAQTISPRLTTDEAGDYTVALVVSDGEASSDAATVTITAWADNATPVANAGASSRTAALGETIAVDGSASSDADGDALTYRWTLVSRPAGSDAVLGSTSEVSSGFVIDSPGDYVVQLVVNDGNKDSAPAQTTVTVEAALALLFHDGTQWTLDTLPHKWVAAQNGEREFTLTEGETTHETKRFKLVAGQKPLTLSKFTVLAALHNEVAAPYAEQIKVWIDGLAEGEVLQPGEERVFRLMGTKAVSGQRSVFRYEFYGAEDDAKASLLFRDMGYITLY